jgi:hypothetical protein
MKMREIISIVESSRIEHFLHGSANELEPGLVLTPRGSGMAGVDGDIEDLLEKNRPAQHPRRDAVIYMAADMRTLENVARDADYIYLVKPLTSPLRLDGSWVNRIWSLFAQNEDDLDNPEIVAEATRYAQGYWSGKPCPAYQPAHEAIWEYMALSAEVISEVTDDI